MNKPPPHVQTFSLSDWMTNCYVIHEPSAPAQPSRPCWIVDAGFEPQPLIDYIKRENLHPTAVLLTHAHADHIAGLSDLRRHWPTLPILVHPAEHAALLDPLLNLSAMLGQPLVAPAATGPLDEGHALEMAGCTFAVFHTPGHSPGGVTLYGAQAALAIVGDVLFMDSVGRSDFPGSDHRTLIHSIQHKLLTLPDATRVLPGHGPDTTIGRERRHNPFLV